MAGAVGLVAAAGSSLPLFTGCGSGSKEGQSLKVGLMTPSTGVASEKGKPGQDGLLDCINYINTELGGVNGYQIDAVHRDSGYDMAKVANIVTEFMDMGCLMFTAMASAEMTAAMALANPAGFPGLCTFTAQNLYHPPKHIYGQMPDYGDDWVAFAKYYKENIYQGSGTPRMALHLLNNSTGKGASDAARAAAGDLGIEIVATEEHAATIQSAIESLTRIKAQNPDVLFISSTPQPTAIILKDARNLGMMPGVTVGCAHASFTKALIDLAGASVAEGVYGVFPTVSWDDNAAGIAKAAEYCQKYNSADYGNMDYLTMWTTGLVVAEILRQAVNNAGYDALSKGDEDSWEALETQGIQKLNNYDVEGLQGPVSYTAGDNRLDKSLRLYRINDGKIGLIKDWMEAPYIRYEDLDWFK
jgi:branched-chain amino acid transport system substrate-binding protein